MLSGMANVIVQGVFTVDSTDRDRFLEASVAGMLASRAEAGCLEYVLAADPCDSGRVVLSERWESQELLNDHMKGPNVRPPADRPRPLSASVVMYEVASENKLI
jgi:quinol monooxygenase YgiN